MSVVATPSVTRALRAYNDPDGDRVSHPGLEVTASGIRWAPVTLDMKRAKLQRDQRESGWRPMVTAIKSKAANRSVDGELRDFRNTVMSLIGSEVDSNTIDQAAVDALIKIGRSGDLESENGKWDAAKIIRERFGSTTDVTASRKAIEIVSDLCNMEAVKDYILSKSANKDQLNDKSEGTSMFGHNIKFKFQCRADIDDIFPPSPHATQEPPPISHTSIAPKAHAGHAATSPVRNENDFAVDRYFLKNACDRAFVGHSLSTVEEMCLGIYDLLASESSDDLLQNQLLELVGFDHFELVQLVFLRRPAIVSATLEAISKLPKGRHDVAVQQPSKKNTGPSAMVSIQSQEEKEAQKALRKEAKRQARAEAKGLDREDLKAALGFDAIRLKQQMEENLRQAAARPLFKSSQPRQRQEKYPNVHNSMQSSMTTSAYVSGAKVLLPPGTIRDDQKDWEKVEVPPTSAAPPQASERRVPISAFSRIGQLAFKGFKTLNRVQSFVYETAYHTNENLLICAPTGAGKTNIAAMTILRCVENFVENGVIQKDQFKIVYIAPMKALAAEMTAAFGKRLQPLGLSVKELTGDMQLTKTEIMATNMLVTTPEKWDVVTRKSTGDVSLTQLVKLLIIDEVHLLHDERGPVIESLVARTARMVESAQTMIRIVGLSATLPNYLDVADFLKVNRYIGLFYFDSAFRPVPLKTTFIGVKAKRQFDRMEQMDEACFEVVQENVRNGYQVMVFVHARNATTKTAVKLRDLAVREHCLEMFQGADHPDYALQLKAIQKSSNKQLKEVFRDGFATHHAGMLRSDRNLVERAFGKGVIKVLCCTATLAWGVNLPAHAVVIKGTQLYNAERGDFVDLGVLDVQQIFGRAGRPQFDTFGEATMITTHDKLSHYLSLMTHQLPIESQFISRLSNHLNAEIALGTVTTVEEGMRWLSYTYLFQRMRKNPLVYGLTVEDVKKDPELVQHRMKLISQASGEIDKARMVRFAESNGYLHPTDLGRVASHYYILVESVVLFNEKMKPGMMEAEIFSMISESKEFDSIKVREEEMQELDRLLEEGCMLHPVRGGTENPHGKVNILLQAYISQSPITAFSLSSDSHYIAQNAARLLRGLFEMVLKLNWPSMASKLVALCKQVDRRMWIFENPLRQFPTLDLGICRKLEKARLTIERMRDMEGDEIGHMIHHVRMGSKVRTLVDQFPSIKLHATVQPITRTVLRVTVVIEPLFTWNTRVHGQSEPWYIWVEDPENEHMYHNELYLVRAEHVKSRNEEERNQTLTFTIPIFEPIPAQYYIRAISDRWIGAETVEPITFKHLILPQDYPPHTELLDLQPLPLTAMKNPTYESLYGYSHFNPIQTQVFHTLYHTDGNVLLGAPTGSGKTIVAELAIYRVFNEYPKCKVVYIAPLKALVRERVDDWQVRFVQKLGKKLVELTGDVTPDVRAIEKADVIVTTPEKWDGVSRSWQNRSYVKSVALVVIDEIHLLGADRGPVLEVIVSRLNYITAHTTHKVRVVGLSTALANAHDLANWLNIDHSGLFNFRPSVRPVPLQIHVQGFPGKHYCPRMASMNKPAYQAIKTYSPVKPALIFVSSRRQTRLTALDLISLASTEDNPKQWLRIPDSDLEHILQNVRDSNLKLALSFGIGMHHAGLHENDRKICEELFTNLKIQVLIATSTLAWGVNMPAHLVVIKGTEFFDGKSKRYVDFPITDVMQMMGRAGRPQFDTDAVAVVFVHDVKKHFYKKFMFEPFPVESSLADVLPDHFNAEIVGGTITSKQDAMDYLTWTYFFRRLVINPAFYGLEEVSQDAIDEFLSTLVEEAVLDLEDSQCVIVNDDGSLEPATAGRICSYYYLSHLTMRTFVTELSEESTTIDLLQLLCEADEFSELPVRHNEDGLNEELAKSCPHQPSTPSWESPYTKAFLLMQAHFGRLQLPVADYLTDTKSVLDQCVRVLQGMIDLAADAGWLATTLQIMQIVQMVIQARWHSDSSLMQIPRVSAEIAAELETSLNIKSLPEFLNIVTSNSSKLKKSLTRTMSSKHADDVYNSLTRFPEINVSFKVKGPGDEEPDLNMLIADEEYGLEVHLNRTGPSLKPFKGANGRPAKAGWWLVLGDEVSGELMALKRVPALRGRSMTTTMSFFTPEVPGSATYILYLISDCFLGLDQQYDIQLNAIEGSHEELDSDVYEDSEEYENEDGSAC